MKDALIELSKAVQTGPCANLVPVLFGEKAPMRSKDAMKFSPFNKNLDDSQVTI
jgi:ATP-dependent RNA/DNA helicase IGHMBP2